jgi:bifunctional oligoribonuclease and PAP phosphatase NrnA
MKDLPKAVESLLEAIRGARRICVVGHIRPDGDCIGSQVGLALALENAGKEVTVWNQDPVPDKLRFLDPDKRVRKPAAGHSFDLIIATDCAAFDRLGRVAECLPEGVPLANIDHHASNTRYGQINWVSPREPSTGELVFDLCKWAGWKITQPIADCLFTAVSTDTGSFQYPSTTPDTLQTAADLVERGANLGRICQEVYQSFPLTRVKLLRHVYSTFRLTHDNRTAYFWLRQRDYARAGATTEESEGLIDHIRSIEGVVVALVFEEAGPDLTRVSFRSKSGKVDVAALAQQFGGGGHKAAAGARISGSPLGVQRRVLGLIKKALKAAGSAVS